jgi:histidinol dehydrogenase
VVLCSPPDGTGHVNDAILAAAAIAGVDEVYAIGGAQAIAAMAFGAGALRPVDVIVGPGNAYVVEAKRQVFGTVGIDGLAGASEVAIVADGSVDPAWVAIDLLAQAEHGPGGAVALIVWDEAVADRVDLALETLLVAASSWSTMLPGE